MLPDFIARFESDERSGVQQPCAKGTESGWMQLEAKYAGNE